MRIKRTKHHAHFTVLDNRVLQGKILPVDAMAVFGYLISLPDGVRRDARSIAANLDGIGRQRVSKALKKLVEARFYFRRKARDASTGRWTTETYLFEEQQPEGFTADDAAAAFGQVKAVDKPARTRRVKKPAKRKAPIEGAAPMALTAAEEWLQRVLADAPQLVLGAAETRELAPIAQPWLDRRIGTTQARSLLTDGLPEQVHSARALVADRLTRKLPAPRVEAAAPVLLAECGECQGPLPREQRTGICGRCAGVTAPPSPEPDSGVPAATRAAAIRATLPRQRTAGSGG